LTLIDADFEGDTYFPDYTQYEWHEIERIENAADDNNPYPFLFVTLERAVIS
jgi:dihydrofolate reductase